MRPKLEACAAFVRATGGEAIVTHTRLEYARIGIEVESGGRLELEHSVLRQIEGSALATHWAAYASLVDTAIDSVCSSNCGAAINSSGYLKFQDSRILASGAVGLYGSPYSDVHIAGGSIEGSKGIGLVKNNYAVGSRTLGRVIPAERPIRITGGASYPAQLPLHFAAAMLPDQEVQDLWRGNARDTLLAVSDWYGTAAKLTIYPGLPWKASHPSGHVTVRLLELEPGAAWTISGRIPVERFVSRGTAESPRTRRGWSVGRVSGGRA